MRHVDIRQHFIRDLKEDGLITIKWIATDENSADIFTKNLYGPTFEKHLRVYVGEDEYMQYDEKEWTTVVNKKKQRKQHPAQSVDRSSAREEGVGSELGAGMLARLASKPIKKGNVKPTVMKKSVMWKTSGAKH